MKTWQQHKEDMKMEEKREWLTTIVIALGLTILIFLIV